MRIFLLYRFGIILSKDFILKIMRLKELRERKNMTQTRLAMDLSLSRYENGTHEADYATLIRIADYFNVSLDYLLERTDNPKINRWPVPTSTVFSY